MFFHMVMSSVTPAASNTAVESLAAVSEIPEDIPERLAYGDINGQLISVGRYYRKPAFQVLNNLYGSVWCVVARNLMDELGDESTIKDVWEGKSVIVSGVLHYGPGGKLRWLDAHSLRGVARPVISLDSVLDPDFTAGMDPVDYLDKLHEGELG